jgi:excisionase family DNA binding protein
MKEAKKMKQEKPDSVYGHYLNVEHAASLPDVSPGTIRKWIEERRIRFYRFGGVMRIRESDLLAFAAVIPDRRSLAENQNMP